MQNTRDVPSTSEKSNRTLSRRTFLVTTASIGGGLAISIAFRDAIAAGSRQAQGAAVAEVGPWMTIAADDSIVLRVPVLESGNGAMTQAARIVAEELQCDWSKVDAECVPLNRDAHDNSIYKVLDGTVFAFAGRSTQPKMMQLLQQIGASARERLKLAAARQWKVPVSQVEAHDSLLTHSSSGRSLRYGEVAAGAAALTLKREPDIKPQKDWTLLNKNASGKLADSLIVNGTGIYGIDAYAPGMLYGAVMQSPVHGGKLKRFDFDAIRSMPGVVGVAVIDPSEPRKTLKTPIAGPENLPQSAIVVVAERYWQARKALDALPLEWDDGPGARWKTTEQVNAAVLAELDLEGDKIVKNEGDALKVLASQASVIESTYLTPFCDQAPLEPLNGMALVTDDRVEVWHSGSIPTQSFIIAAEEAGVPLERVHLHSTLIGGNFGRRNFADDLRLVVATAKKFPGRPVKVIWSREEMMRQGRYRWLTAGKLRATLSEDGMPQALHARVCRPGYGIAGLDNVPYTNGLIPHTRIETRDFPLHVMWGSYRAPGYNSYAFFLESFIDECAAAANIDPLNYRLRLLAKCPDPGWEKCLREVAARAEWGKTLPRGQAQGVAISNWGNWATKGPQGGTTVAVIAHVDVSRAGELRVLQLDLAFDCGRTLDTDTVIAQMQGGAIFGLNMCMNEALSIQDGRIVEGNFDQYPMLRMADVPKINIHLGGLTGHDRFAEVGEPPVGPIGPAVANAIFRATGKRLRTMPFRQHDLRWS